MSLKEYVDNLSGSNSNNLLSNLNNLLELLNKKEGITTDVTGWGTRIVTFNKESVSLYYIAKQVLALGEKATGCSREQTAEGLKLAHRVSDLFSESDKIKPSNCFVRFLNWIQSSYYYNTRNHLANSYHDLFN